VQVTRVPHHQLRGSRLGNVNVTRALGDLSMVVYGLASRPFMCAPPLKNAARGPRDSPRRFAQHPRRSQLDGHAPHRVQRWGAACIAADCD
jgi:hypothetical protein